MKRGLIPIPTTLRSLGFNQTTPANGPPGTFSRLTFSEDNSKLIVSYKGANAPGFLLTWDVQPDSGALSKDYTKVAVDGAMLPFSLTRIPGEDAFLLTDPGRGFEVVDLSGKQRGAAVSVSGNGATCWGTRSAKTGNYYAVDVGANAVREVHVDGNLGASVVAVRVSSFSQVSLTTVLTCSVVFRHTRLQTVLRRSTRTPPLSGARSKRIFIVSAKSFTYRLRVATFMSSVLVLESSRCSPLKGLRRLSTLLQSTLSASPVLLVSPSVSHPLFQSANRHADSGL